MTRGIKILAGIAIACFTIQIACGIVGIVMLLTGRGM